MAEDLQRLQRDLEHQYSDLSLGAIIAVLNRIPAVLPPSQGLPPEAVGMEDPSKHVTQLLNMESESIIAVVIYGQGGIGKTTLATIVFAKLNLKNYKFCRVDMQQDCKDLDLQKLQQQILRDLFQRNIELRNCNEGRDELSKEIKKATSPLFIFVDNALRESDFQKLLPINDLASLPPQSRILITTRNLNESRIILQAGIERFSYLVDFLPVEKAHKLLCKVAFGKVQASFDPTIDIEGLLQKCGGVPLVLTLGGARLREHTQSEHTQSEHTQSVFTQSVRRCRAKVEYLKSWLSEGEDGEMSECMVDFVYDRLERSSKEAFLDIVFFFCNWKWRKVVNVVGETELEELERAALVNITDEGRVKVHDIVQARGKRLSPHGERITNKQSLNDVLQTEERIKKIKGITDVDQLEARHLNLMSRCLRVMNGIRIVNGECKGAFENLRCLRIDRRSYSLMDVTKHPRLAVLMVYGSGQFSGVSSPSALKYMALEDSTLANLSTTLSQLRTLRVLKLVNCKGFDSLPESIGDLTALEKLDLCSCENLVRLPDSFGQLCSLTYLRLRDCRQLSALPESFGNLASLDLLSLDGCQRLLNLPQNFGQLKRLKYLSIYKCSELESLSADFEGLSSLIAIDASDCDELKGDTIEKVAKMKGLMMVDIEYSKELEERWKQVRDQCSLAVVRRFSMDCGDTMGRALLQSGSRLVHGDEISPPDIVVEGVELSVLLTVCDLTRAGNGRYLEEVKKKWEEVGGEKKKVFVEMGVSWEESERRAKEMLPLLPRGSHAWIAADSRARLLFAYSLFKANSSTEYQPTVIAGISARMDEEGKRPRMHIDDFIIPDCTPDFEDAHILDQLFSPLSKAQSFIRL